MKRSLVLFLFFLWVGCSEKAAEAPILGVQDSTLQAYLKSYSDKETSLADRLARSREVLKQPEALPDSTYLKILGQRAGLHRSNQEMDSAVYYSERQLQEATRLQDSAYMAQAHFRLGFYHRSLDQFNASLEHYYHTIELYRALGDSLNAGTKLLNLSNLLNSLGNYGEAENIAVEGLKYLEGSGEKKYLAGLYMALATATKELKNYEDAVAWYQKAMELAEDAETRMKVQSNIAITRLWQGENQAALELLSELATDTAFVALDERNRARVLDYLGVAQHRLSQPGALENLQEALRLREATEYTNGVFISHQHLAEYYIEKDPGRALTLAREALAISEKLQNPEDRLSSLALLVELDPNPKTYALEYKRLGDSLQQFRQTIKDQFAKIRYESEKNQRDYLIAKEEASQNALGMQKAQFRNVLMAFFIGILFLAGYFLFRFLKLQHRKRELQAVYQTEKRIAKKVHDELANDIFNLMNKVAAKQENDTDPDDGLVSDLDLVYQKSRAISRDSGALPTGAQFKEALKSLMQTYSTASVRLITKGFDAISWERMGTEKQVGLYRALQELLVNMQKHSGASHVFLEFNVQKRHLEITYRDNGKGFAADNNVSGGGLENTENRIEALGGTFTFDRKAQKGASFIITLPY